MNSPKVVSILPHHIAELTDPLLGATVIKKVNAPLDHMIGAMTELLNSMKVPPPGNLVSNYSFLCLPIIPGVWKDFADTLAGDLNSQLRDQLQIVDTINFDDLYLTRYFSADSENTALGVSPHRDTNCKGVVATLILKGTLPSAVCKEKDMKDPVIQEVASGEILLMRTAGCGNLNRPLHYVGEVGWRSVIQFGMRQYIQKH